MTRILCLPKCLRAFPLFALALGFGCATQRHAVPEGLSQFVTVGDMNDIRAMSGAASDYMVKDFIGIIAKYQTDDPSFFQENKSVECLAISGGGGNGAYGAGLLCGWSKSGARPQFTIVTGISTGAIIAPFAFLGSQYDAKLKEFYTDYSTKDLIKKEFLTGALFGDSLLSNAPLERLIDKNIDAALLKKIADEYAKGRRLYVGTTNFDEQKLVAWDMGKIASYGDDEALRLFRKIILASSAIPVAFPPVYIDVHAGNTHYEEMHVDGGVTKQVFFLYDMVSGFGRACKVGGIDPSKIHFGIFIIRNGYAESRWKRVPDNLAAISQRAIATLINTQGVGDLYQLYVYTKDGGGDFNLAYIPSSHVQRNKEMFDPVEMRALFKLGYDQAVNGYPWRKAPPGLDE
jgi:predicted patatin/cPLA2 family phospholipase